MASGALRFLHLDQITERLGGESCVGRERRWEPGISMSPTNLRLRHRARFHMYQLVEHALQIVAICPNKVDPQVMFNNNKIVTAVDPYWAAGRRTPRRRVHAPAELSSFISRERLAAADGSSGGRGRHRRQLAPASGYHVTDGSRHAGTDCLAPRGVSAGPHPLRWWTPTSPRWGRSR